MKRLGIALAVATLLVVGSAPLSAHAQAPNILKIGYIINYVANIYVTGVTQVTGSGCSFSAGDKSSAQLEITSSGQSVTFVGANPDDSSGAAVSFFLFLPPLPKGLSTSESTSWTGSYMKLVLPGGTESAALPFSGSLRLTGKLTFVGTMTFTDMPYSGGSASCTVAMQFSSVLSGITQQ